MSSEADRFEKELGRVLELSGRQVDHLVAERFAEMLECQAERERIFAGLGGLGPAHLSENPRLNEIINLILENDRQLALHAESIMGEIGGRLGRLKKGSRAFKAYSSS